MEETNMEQQPQGGKLVALEGDIDTISTQLRLLPPSQKILVLPSVIDSVELGSSQQPFDARLFIRDVYLALAERTKTAQSFLSQSTLKQPRLVFVNGASVYASSTCILKISEKLTNGDVQEAETIFNEIARYGVARLLSGYELEEEEVVGEEEEQTREERLTAPPTKSNMTAPKHPDVALTKAADVWENDTTALQSSVTGMEVDHSLHLHNSNPTMTENTVSIPNTGLDSLEQPESTVATATGLPFQQIHTPGENIVAATLAFQDRQRVLVSQAAKGRRHSLNETRKSSYFGIDPADDAVFDEVDISLSIPPSPGVVYGTAEMFDVQARTSERQLKRSKSAYMVYANKSSWSASSQSIPTSLQHTNSAFSVGRPTSSVEFGEAGFHTTPKKTFIRASPTLIKKSSSSTRSTSSVSERDVKVAQLTPQTLFVDRGTDAEIISGEVNSSQLTPQNLFVDRGTDAEVILEAEIDGGEECEEYVPVFPLVEDLVIQLTDSNRNEVIDSVIRSYKNGSYPTVPPVPESISNRSSNIGPVSGYAAEDIGSVLDSIQLTETPLTETDDLGYESQHSYDPYNSNEPSFSTSGTKEKRPPRDTISRADSGVQMPDIQMQSLNRPPTPRNHIAGKFVELSKVDATGTISLQNSLRELLSHHLPAGEGGYSQHLYQFSPEADRLWKPVFRNDSFSSLDDDGRTVDQIICLGCEAGVQKEFFSQISGSIERLGMKKDGTSRSAKLDISYLIANMMQSYFTLPLTVQSTFNPLSDNTILATLLIPQIEAYLASNSATRLLILHYQPSHLPTVFALRRLLGTGTLKIAGILNSLSSDPPSSVSRPKTPISKYNSNPLFSEPAKRLRHQASHAESLRDINRKKSSPNITSVAKANFLLPSPATDTEITTFLSEIWKCLVEKSSFYAPDPRPEPMTVERRLSNETPPVPLSKDPPSKPEPPQNQLCESCSNRKERRDNHNLLNPERSDRNDTYPPPPLPKPTSSPPTNGAFKAARLLGNTKADITRAIPSVKPKTESRPADTRSLGRGGGSDNRSLKSKGERRADGTWENFYIGDEDSADDEFDKMILGRKHAKIVPEVRKVGGKDAAGKRNKQKALKWLGLA